MREPLIFQRKLPEYKFTNTTSQYRPPSGKRINLNIHMCVAILLFWWAVLFSLSYLEQGLIGSVLQYTSKLYHVSDESKDESLKITTTAGKDRKGHQGKGYKSKIKLHYTVKKTQKGDLLKAMTQLAAQQALEQYQEHQKAKKNADSQY